ncbi:MAG: hypothetical protein ACTSX9_07095 [Candidatus Njordarchaeales archaeon]
MSMTQILTISMIRVRVYGILLANRVEVEKNMLWSYLKIAEKVSLKGGKARYGCCRVISEGEKKWQR